jgi:hypothetical protein
MDHKKPYMDKDNTITKEKKKKKEEERLTRVHKTIDLAA